MGAEHFFKKYKTELGRDDPCCPLCHRGFESTQEVRELILEVMLLGSNVQLFAKKGFVLKAEFYSFVKQCLCASFCTD